MEYWKVTKSGITKLRLRIVRESASNIMHKAYSQSLPNVRAVQKLPKKGDDYEIVGSKKEAELLFKQLNNQP